PELGPGGPPQRPDPVVPDLAGWEPLGRRGGRHRSLLARVGRGRPQHATPTDGPGPAAVPWADGPRPAAREPARGRARRLLGVAGLRPPAPPAPGRACV